MTPPATASAASIAVMAFTLLGSLLPTSSFVPLASRGQAPRQSSRRPPPSSSRFAGPLQMTTPAYRQRQQRQQIFMPAGASSSNLAGHPRRRTPSGDREEVSLPRPRRCRSLQPLGLGGMDEMEDMDPLEAGPDPDEILLQGEPELLRQQQEEEDYEAELAAAEAATVAAGKAPTKAELAEAAVAAAMASKTVGEGGGADEVAMAALGPKRKKRTEKVRIDPLMPRGGVAPNEWLDMANLAEGVRGILVVCHTGLPKDKKRAAEVMNAVKERYGHVIHTHEWWDDDEELTDDDREDAGTFEVWLEGPTIVHYHERADGKLDLDDEQLDKILDDLEERVMDEAILGQYINEDFQFRLPGFTAPEQRFKQFPVL
ncbi:unnamed protein product [Ectocarpus sp. 13 AM-2016]